MIRILLVAGARPNFMKIAPIIRALNRRNGQFDFRLVHTGQHYDRDMSDVFFEELEIPKPDHYLEVGSGSHAEQTARIMIRFEAVCLQETPDLVMVVGDVNSTLACTLVAKKLQIQVAHVEAGLRSGDLAMPEEINRIVTDALSDFLFVTEPSGVSHLLAAGRPPDAIFLVGHVMIDNLLHQIGKLEQLPPESLATEKLKRELGRYGVVTLHRPANVDEPETLRRILDALGTVARTLPLVFPMHPRTRSQLKAHGLELPPRITALGPRSYQDFLNLFKDAVMVLTDSGGLQEETTALGIPCLTLRENTERPITVDQGTNLVVGTSPERIIAEAEQILRQQGKAGRRPELWDGQAAERIVETLERRLGVHRDSPTQTNRPGS
jgi:UDP-N-acetylglucosamine 2-epimerase (non-hydrolysing)